MRDYITSGECNEWFILVGNLACKLEYSPLSVSLGAPHTLRVYFNWISFIAIS